MTKRQIEIAKRKITKSLKTIVHPDNPLAIEMNKRFRELELMEKDYTEI